MDVLLVSPLPPPHGGISQWTAMIQAHAAETDGPRLRVLDTAPRSRPAMRVSLARRLAEGVGRMLVDNVRLLRELILRRPDVIHLNTSGQIAFVRDGAMLVLARLFRVPVVYHLRFGRVPEIARARTREWRWATFALRRAATVVAIDPATEHTVREQHLRAPVVRMPNPVTAERFVDPTGAADRRQVVLFVGWLLPAKGIGELLESWRAVDHAGWTLELVGPVDPDYRATLEISGLPDGVTLVGPLDPAGVRERMWTSRVFAFPSHTEGFPNAVTEAMAAGLAVVGSDVGAIADMLADGAGVVVPPRDAAALTGALGSLLHSPASVARLGSAAREKARSLYALDRVYAEYVELWERVATGG